MKKITLLAASSGVFVAVALGLIGLYEYHHPGAKLPLSDMTSRIALWLWPTGMFLIDANEDLTGLVAWAISAVANGMIYGTVAFSITWLWKELTTPRAVREANKNGWWPTKPSDR